MTFEEFEIQMNRLTGVYGDKAYPTERRKIIWNKFRETPIGVFKKTIESCIADHAMAPMLSKIETEMRQHWREYFESNPKHIREPQPCAPCESSGILFAFKKNVKSNSFTFRCPSCSNAGNERLSKSIIQWSDNFLNKYDLVKPNKITESPLRERDINKLILDSLPKI